MLLTASMATIMAIARELSNASFPLVRSRRFRWTSPSLGRVTLVSAEFVLVMVLCFYKLNPNDEWQWEDMAYRTGFIALAQMPLIFLLAGKNNMIGFLIGSSYERLNWLHRWTARILFITVTIHMGFWFVDWARYDYIKVKLTKDVITKRGFASWCILLWIVLSSFAPIRRWNYEFFVLQHIVSFAGFTVAVYLHVPAEVKVWVWIPIGLVIFDRVVRALSILYMNLSVFHPTRRHEGFWACKAAFEPLGSDITRIIIKNPPINWTVGQHVLLSCHSIAPFQSHPFTVASIPQDGKMEFLIKTKSGSTKRFFRHAQKYQSLPLTNTNSLEIHTFAVIIEGPYGNVPPLQQFDSIFFIAGSSGSTFTVPLMRNIVASWKVNDAREKSSNIIRLPRGAVTRYIRFVWVVKSRDQFSWFAAQLTEVAQDVEQLRSDGHDVYVDMSIYVTCDEDLVAEGKEPFQPARLAPIHGKPVESPPLATEMTEKDEKAKDNIVSVQSTLSPTQTPQDSQHCGPGGVCCCGTTIEEEADLPALANRHECHCGSDNFNSPGRNSSAESSESSETSASHSDVEKPVPRLLHPSIAILSRRPQPKNLIRKTLEQALGESAIVVCGPHGLVDDVSQCTVALSDERAVHKGSGAQGIYLHTEAFDY